MTSFTQVSSKRDLLSPIRNWLESIEVHNRAFAHRLCKLIPAQCPFERDIVFFGKTLFHIPPMCKLNPFYEQVVILRFKAMCYLADECGEDITAYC
ncbi:MAG: Mo-dependent nitrogenase C-terminal domain-containing protein [Cyanobacteria bacterium P01_A01_bin.84]